MIEQIWDSLEEGVREPADALFIRTTTLLIFLKKAERKSLCLHESVRMFLLVNRLKMLRRTSVPKERNPHL